MWIPYNENPHGKRTGDCTVRAVSLALGVDWETAFDLMTAKAKAMGEMPSKDSVWSAVLRDHGFLRRAIPNFCPECYTVAEFASEHFRGVYVLAVGGHVVTVINGNYYDLWDSGNEIPQFYFFRKDD